MIGPTGRDCVAWDRLAIHGEAIPPDQLKVAVRRRHERLCYRPRTAIAKAEPAAYSNPHRARRAAGSPASCSSGGASCPS